MRDALQEFIYWVCVRPEQVKPLTILKLANEIVQYWQHSLCAYQLPIHTACKTKDQNQKIINEHLHVQNITTGP